MAATGGIRAGRAFVELGVRDKIAKGLRKAQKRLRAFGAGISSMGRGLALASASILAPITAMVKGFAAAGDQLDKMSKRTGFSAEALSELSFAAEQSGSDLETFEKGVRTLQRSINDAGRGLSTAVDALADLGLGFKDLDGLSPEDQFKLIADRLDQIEDPGKRAAVAMMLLGRAGTQLLPMMRGGAKGIEELQQQARDLGLTISTDTASAAAKLTDTINILRRVAKQASIMIGSVFADAVGRALDGITRLVVNVTKWIRKNREMIALVGKVAVGVLLAGSALIAVGLAAQVAAFAIGGLLSIASIAAAVFTAIGGVLAFLVSPIGLVIAAVAGLGTAFLVHSGVAGDAITWLGDTFQTLRKAVGDVIGGISDALAAGDVALAANVLWAGVKVAWEAGIKPLRKAWEHFRFAFERLSIQAFAGMQKAWIHVSDWMYKNFPETTAFIAKTWAKLTGVMRSTWAKFSGWIQKRFIEMEGLFNDVIDVEAAQASVDEDLNEFLSKIEGDTRASVAEAERKAGRTDAEREAETAASLAEVDTQRGKALSDLEAGFQKRLASAEDALQGAKDEFAAARDKARKAREDAEGKGGDGGDGKKPPPRVQFQDIGAEVAKRISIAGTFSAAALAGLGAGGGSMAERTAKATEDTAKNTKKIARNGGAQFA